MIKKCLAKLFCYVAGAGVGVGLINSAVTQASSSDGRQQLNTNLFLAVMSLDYVSAAGKSYLYQLLVMLVFLILFFTITRTPKQTGITI